MDDFARNRELALAVRQALLMIVDALERWLGISPTTSEIRKQERQTRKEL